MTKPVLFLLFLFVFANAFAQSPRKQNKILKKELESCREQSNPLLETYLEKKKLKDSMLVEAKKRNYLLRQEELPAKELFLKTRQLIADLMLLGIDIEMVVGPDSMDAFPDYKMFIGEIDDLLYGEDRGVGMLSGSPNLKGLEIEEQNKILKDLVFECNAYTGNLTYRLNKLGPDQKRLQKAIPQMDSMILVYQSLTRALRAKKVQLERKLIELRENYRLKGPAGFSEGYKTVFPDLFNPEDGPVYVEQAELILEPADPKMDIYTVVDEEAQFPGGMASLKRYLGENIHYPEIAADLGIDSKWAVQFVVSENGYISNVKMKNPMTDCPECDAEIIRVVKLMPLWTPAKVNGKAVNSWYFLPVQICLK